MLSVSALIASHGYCFRVRARNHVGFSDWSSIDASACFSTLSAAAPGKPVLPTLPEDANASVIYVAWDPPSNGGSVITGYELQQDNFWTKSPLATVYNGAAPLFTANVHLLPATSYSFRVRATNAIGTGVSVWLVS